MSRHHIYINAGEKLTQNVNINARLFVGPTCEENDVGQSQMYIFL